MGFYVLLQKYGLTWNDIRRQELAYHEQLAALENGKVDAAYSTEPFVTIAHKSGVATIVMSEDQWYPNQQLAAVVIAGDFMQKRPELVRHFMRGYVRGMRFYHAALKNGKFAGPGSEDIIKILNEVTKPRDPGLYRETAALYVTPDARLDLASIKRALDYFRGQGLIASSTIGVDDVVDPSWLNRAVRELGPNPNRKA